MIHISDIAKRIKTFLEEKGVERFKIYIRINFQIDVYIVASQYEEALNYEKEFFNEISGKSDLNQTQVVKDENNEPDMSYASTDGLKVRFNIISERDALEDPFYSNIFTTDGEVIDWGPRYRFGSLLENESSKINNPNQVPVVTFYSYKGGMGRTTTMIAYALHLAVNKKGKKKTVAIIDCDLEAPGYLNFFDLKEHDGLNNGKKNGLVEFICDAQFTDKPENIDINDYIVNVGIDNVNSFTYNDLDNIWLVPAGNLNEGYRDAFNNNTDRNDYLEGLAKINLSSVQTLIGYFSLLFNKINETIHPDVILIDSRTGFNDIFGTAALYLSSCVVGFFGFSRQTQPGLINLIKEYYNNRNRFAMQLVFSILPENVEEEWLENQIKPVKEYVDNIGNEEKDYPSFSYLRRRNLLERIGMGDKLSDTSFVELVKTRQNPDYNEIFKNIDRRIFPQLNTENETWNVVDSNNVPKLNDIKEESLDDKPPLQLRNIILRHLQKVLTNVKNFAEDTNIVEEQFFYRECMKQLYDVKKFIIRGYKGTGKTYLYKALTNKKISDNIKKWAGIDEENTKDTIFVNILPPTDRPVVFYDILYSQIEEPEYYFNLFWQIYTWNVLLLIPEFESIKNSSELKDYILPLECAEAFLRIDTLIKRNIYTRISIEKDIVKLNDYLSQNNKTLFVLYDRLDTCINPLRWNKAVSPLINYWRNNCETFSNIVPKIFVRTDLFKQKIEGTNTARLSNNIIEIEWKIGEVFGYFFKLIFSDKYASDAYWAIAKKIGVKEYTITSAIGSFKKFPENQFKNMEFGDMAPIISVFFGNRVVVGDRDLGNPWEYFNKEMSNADRSSISLRPFINTLDHNAVDEALGQAIKLVREIIPPRIYASQTVRMKATDEYFKDLAKDEFSKDLLRFREVVMSSEGRYKYKALNESLFDELIKTTFKKIEDIGKSEVVKTKEDLKELITANGIIARYFTTKGTLYRFAPIYWYSWGLANSILDEDRIFGVKYFVGQIYEGVIVLNKKGEKCVSFAGYSGNPLLIAGSDLVKSTSDVGTKVIFTVIERRDNNSPDLKFPLATNVQLANSVGEKDKYNRNYVIGKDYNGEICINSKGKKCVSFDELPDKMLEIKRKENALDWDIGTKVIFVVGAEPNYVKPNVPHFYPYNIRRKDEVDNE